MRSREISPQFPQAWSSVKSRLIVPTFESIPSTCCSNTAFWVVTTSWIESSFDWIWEILVSRTSTLGIRGPASTADLRCHSTTTNVATTPRVSATIDTSTTASTVISVTFLGS